MKIINWLLFDTRPGDIGLAAFETVTGLAFDFPAGSDARPSLVVVRPERAVLSGVVTFTAALLTLAVLR